MTSIAPLENVESVTATFRMPLMYADNVEPATSISSWYQVDVL